MAARSRPGVYLASASPRRKELLDQLGIAHRVIRVSVDESPGSGEAPAALACRLAVAKAERGLADLRAGGAVVVLGADTIVVSDVAMLGKPRDAAAAEEMLARLSGRTHEVLSAVALAAPDAKTAVRLSSSRVRLRRVSAAERRAYCATREPLDKAGGYAIQGRAAAFVEHLEGSYSGVMGLPLCETAALLSAAGVEVFVAGRPGDA